MAGMLNGVTVLELGQVIAGTFGGVILADMGADVIKIEPLLGDANRNAAIAPLYGESAIHLFMNRNKKSVAIDLKSPEGLELFYQLVEQADVIIDNFRPGVMARLGIDHAKLEARNPNIITASVTGFGEYGPAKDRPAFDLVVQAVAGHLHITGEPDGPPSRVGIPLADIAGGLFACISVLGALCGRGLHGKGSHTDVAMLDSLVSLLSYDALDHLNTGRDITRQGTAHAHMVPWQALSVRDGYIVIAAREEKFWQRICDAIDRPDLKDDPRTATNGSRVVNRSFVTSVLEPAFAQKTKAQWMTILDSYDIPAAPVNDLTDVFADPQVVARGLVRSYDHPDLGEIRYPASPMQIDGWTFPNLPAPVLAEHTVLILHDWLGLDKDVIADLAERRVIGVPEHPAGLNLVPPVEGVRR
ncbi:MAG TPA: CoA transferase [Mycobacteriales bacterium]|jgi:crotonobetainyl-CoA:carnitine CoA-transferase CaiB-like acyl-CoA transferase|nr:CoA transferase [Mycobacteriales bacterium]